MRCVNAEAEVRDKLSRRRHAGHRALDVSANRFVE